MQQNNKYIFNVISYNNNQPARELKQNIKSWQNGKQNIKYTTHISAKKTKYLNEVFLHYSMFILLFIFGILFWLFPCMIKNNFDSCLSALLNSIINKPKDWLPYGIILVFCLIYSCILPFLDIKKGVIVNIDKSRKKVIIKTPKRVFIFFNNKIIIPFHSNLYLPEMQLSKKEKNKYQDMLSEFQQTISKETMLQFNTPQFVAQSGEKLGIELKN